MSVILATSVLARVLALAGALWLLLRVRDWRMGVFVLTLALLTLGEALTLAKDPAWWPIRFSAHRDEWPGVLVSTLLLGVAL